ncbi:hypothetical protein S40285_07924 [Stachybotrys chlorohalonatus IBT 40285]|uniref:FAD/NAD(P)-binding domain-containing protein n=1 Tax=Stachybotrys chlorohalonatus (strain IBT 40285) TaxID=1283841 RepID=A0A084R107_STAC4|nr:hypothetical protein S40285_07924 [Stachybotrys chlorohalonata IBT 40285]
MAIAVEQVVPSHQRCAPGSINLPVAKFPDASFSSETVDPGHVASQFVKDFNQLLQKRDLPSIAGLFTENGFWRDHLALSWNFRTVQSPRGILEYLEKSAGSRNGFRLQKIALDNGSPERSPLRAPVDGEGAVPGVRTFLTLKTSIGKGTGLVRLVEENGSWKAFTLYTRLDELSGHEEAINDRRPFGADHAAESKRKNWADERREETSIETGYDPDVLIIGAGQAGLTAAARLKMLGVKTLIIDEADRVGDNWRKRYHQLVLHDPVWYDHLPYINFPSSWPIFTPKDKLADFFESYATLLDLNIWTQTSFTTTPCWNESEKRWTVQVSRKIDGKDEVRTFHPHHIIQATGHSGKKAQPSFKGLENFQGDRICHSSEFREAQQNGRGKKAVVVGSGNSAHDIAQDFLGKGYDTTIVQRSSTCVVGSNTILETSLKGLYSEDGPHVDDADVIDQGTPLPVLKAMHVTLARKQADLDKDIHEGLAKAGFEVDRGPDGAGLFIKYFQRGGGYYIDVGASRLIANGDIKVKHGQEIKEILPHGIRFADDSELEADEIVLATGYQSTRSQTRAIFGDKVADKIGDVWGINSDGEMNTVWQKSGHEGFWFHGGNLALCRYYSLLLALQIKGLQEGIYQYGEI